MYIEMNWLKELIERLFSWIPRICLVNPDEGGVRITCGSHYRRLDPGWFLYWPVLQECQVISVTPQIADVRPQSVLTLDKIDLCIGGGVKYRIDDPVKALLKVIDYDKTLCTAVLGVISEHINSKNFSDRISINDLKDIVLSGVKKEARGWGLDIQRIYITDLGTTRNLRLLADRGTPGVIVDEGDKNGSC